MRSLLLAGGAGLVLVASLTVPLVLLTGEPAGDAALTAFFLVLFLVLPLVAALRRSPPRRHPGRKTDPEAVAAIHAARRPGPRARLVSILRGAGIALGFLALFWFATWALTEAFTSWLFIPVCLLAYAGMVHLGYRITHERHLKMRSLGPRTSDRVRKFQRKEITNPKVHSKWEV